MRTILAILALCLAACGAPDPDACGASEYTVRPCACDGGASGARRCAFGQWGECACGARYDCTYRACGASPLGGNCGTCPGGQTCADGFCVAQ
jgi:hypothetical protein